MHFRVVSNTTWHCHNGPQNPAWSYVDETDSGAKAKIATLLTAYALGKTVTAQT